MKIPTFTKITFAGILIMSTFCLGRDIKVAVIDTGVDVNHPALKNKLWTDSKAPLTHGWDFSNSGTIKDQVGHGTHIASIIASDDEKGNTPHVKLLILKYYDTKDQKKDPLQSSVQALQKALDENVDIVNYSGGGREFSTEEFKIIEKMNNQGILVVAAAGNESSDIEAKPFYPASYHLPNIISVSAIDSAGTPVPSSNHGSQSIHIAAVGKKVWAALPEGRFGALTGTSQATAQVTKSVVLWLQELDRKPSPAEIKSRIMKTGIYSQELRNNNAAASKLSTDRLLKMKDIGEPIRRPVSETRTLAGGLTSP